MESDAILRPTKTSFSEDGSEISEWKTKFNTNTFYDDKYTNPKPWNPEIFFFLVIKPLSQEDALLENKVYFSMGELLEKYNRWQHIYI